MKKKELFIGVGMLAAFTVVLILMFSPVFNGQNGLEYLDALYNSISKGSAYYIPKVKTEKGKFMGKSSSMTLPAVILTNSYASLLTSTRLGWLR